LVTLQISSSAVCAIGKVLVDAVVGERWPLPAHAA
jgi:hypothetical protein